MDRLRHHEHHRAHGSGNRSRQPRGEGNRSALSVACWTTRIADNATIRQTGSCGMKSSLKDLAARRAATVDTPVEPPKPAANDRQPPTAADPPRYRTAQ